MREGHVSSLWSGIHSGCGYLAHDVNVSVTPNKHVPIILQHIIYCDLHLSFNYFKVFNNDMNMKQT